MSAVPSSPWARVWVVGSLATAGLIAVGGLGAAFVTGHGRDAALVAGTTTVVAPFTAWVTARSRAERDLAEKLRDDWHSDQPPVPRPAPSVMPNPSDPPSSMPRSISPRRWL